MIQIPTMKEIQDLFIKVDKLNERTKRQTKQIKELQKRVRDLEK